MSCAWLSCVCNRCILALWSRQRIHPRTQVLQPDCSSQNPVHIHLLIMWNLVVNDEIWVVSLFLVILFSLNVAWRPASVNISRNRTPSFGFQVNIIRLRFSMLFLLRQCGGAIFMEMVTIWNDLGLPTAPSPSPNAENVSSHLGKKTMQENLYWRP